MKLRKLKVIVNKKFIEIDPSEITNIIIEDKSVMSIEKTTGPTIKVYKNSYDYSHWSFLLSRISVIFDVELTDLYVRR